MTHPQRRPTNVHRPLALCIHALLLGAALGNPAGAQQFPATLNLGSLDGNTGVRIDGVAASDLSGHSVSNAGDINGDGIDDLIIGAYGANPNGNNSGSSYLVFGRSTPFAATLALASLDGSTGFRLDGEAERDYAGSSVSGAGDINGDGIDDLIIGANGANPNGIFAGSSYLVFGRSTPFPATLALASLDGSTGFRLDGIAAGDYTGFSVSDAGDINGDGIDDLIIGARGAGPNGSGSGSSYLVFGRSTPFPATLALASLNGSTGFRLDGAAAGDYAGTSVSAAGDVNGDGIDDLIIGAAFADPNGNGSGSSYLVFGRSTPFPATLNLGSLDGSTGFRLDGAAAGDAAGASVSAAGDINGDGIDDLIIGAYSANPNGSNSGSSYLVFGRSTPFPATLALASLDGSIGFRLDGAASGDYAGASVSAAGDINGDGIDDLIIGARNAGPNGSSYLVFGRTTPFPASVALSSLNGSTGVRLDGAAANDRAGFSVSAADDINGDGIDDLIIGARGADPNGSGSGSSYVVFGRDTETVFRDGFE